MDSVMDERVDSKHQIQPGCDGELSRLTRDETAEPIISRDHVYFQALTDT